MTNPTPQFFTSLLETGASNTCISPKVAEGLGLHPTGMQQMASATHVIAVNTYLMDVGVVFGGNVLWQSNLQVLEFQPTAGSPYEILMGRDLICEGALTVSFEGHYTFSI